MTELKIYGFAPSTYTKTALMVAAEAEVPVTLVPLEFKTPSHYALHPYGKMPVLEHDEVTYFETLAIAVYVDRVFGGSRLQPTDPREQARMLQWASVAVDYVYEDLVSRLLGDDTDAESIAAAGEQLKLLDAGLGDGPYFAGDRLSIADLMLYPMVSHAISHLGQSTLNGLPALCRWHSMISDRPSAKDAA